jgi:hypothetical protein
MIELSTCPVLLTKTLELDTAQVLSDSHFTTRAESFQDTCSQSDQEWVM